MYAVWSITTKDTIICFFYCKNTVMYGKSKKITLNKYCLCENFLHRNLPNGKRKLQYTNGNASVCTLLLWL